LPVFAPGHDAIQIVKEPQLRSQTNSYIATELELLPGEKYGMGC
jgi:hypothetical protein